MSENERTQLFDEAKRLELSIGSGSSATTSIPSVQQVNTSQSRSDLPAVDQAFSSSQQVRDAVFRDWLAKKSTARKKSQGHGTKTDDGSRAHRAQAVLTSQQVRDTVFEEWLAKKSTVLKETRQKLHEQRMKEEAALKQKAVSM